MGRLGSGPRVVGRLGSGVWVSASFQFFLALTVLCGEGNFPDVGMSGGSMSEGEMSREEMSCTPGLAAAHHRAQNPSSQQTLVETATSPTSPR